MNKKIVAAVLSFSLAAACLAGCGSGDETEPTETTTATNVTVATVETRSISSTASYTGELMTTDKASVTSKVSAKIKSINCEVGDYVKAGETLIVLDSSDYEYQLKSAQATKEQADAAYKQAQASVESAEANVASAQAGVASAEAGIATAQAGVTSAQVAYDNVKNGSSEQTLAQLEAQLASAQIAYNDAKTNYDRQEQLYNMGAISLVTFESAKTALETAKLNLETAQTSYDLNKDVLSPGNEASAQQGIESAQAAVGTAEAGLESAKAALQGAQASLETARASLDSAKASQSAAQVAISQAQTSIANTKVTAPISGYISAKNVSLGQFASTGVELMAITGIGELEAEIQVTEAVVPYLSVGGEALITVSSASLDTIEGIITVVNPVKNAQGMYTVRVSVPNDDDKLKVGMFADVVLVTDQSASEALSVPANSILQGDGEYYVYVASGSFAEKRTVVTGVSDGAYTQIVSGLSEGEVVVVSGKEYLSEENNMINVVE